MPLLRLKQHHFRNLKTAELVLPGGVSAVVGANAQGKTNLLEAIYLALGGELRSGLADRLAFGQPQAWLMAELETQLGAWRLENRFSHEGREIRLNETPTSLRELAQLPGAVWLQPTDLELVLGSPEQRRRFLDSLLSRFSQRYRQLLNLYGRALQQRNAVLRSGGRQIGLWNQELARHGSEILLLRRRILHKLQPLAQQVFAELAPGKLELTMVESVTPERLLPALEEGWQADLERGLTSVGPHRDDLALTIDRRDTQRFASRGEARSVALALRLAEHRLLWQHYQEAPLLLVDEWHTELDDRRQAALLAYAQSLPQAVLAGLEEPPGAAARVWIEGGVWGLG